MTKFAKAILEDVNLDENGDPILKKKKKKDKKKKKSRKKDNEWRAEWNDSSLKQYVVQVTSFKTGSSFATQIWSFITCLEINSAPDRNRHI